MTKKLKVQVSLTQETLDNLDFIARHSEGGIESRSAAIRWATQVAVQSINEHDQVTSRQAKKPRKENKP